MDQFKNNGVGAFGAARKMVPGKDHHFVGKTMRQMRDPVDARLGHNIASLESLWLVRHFELKIPDSGWWNANARIFDAGTPVRGCGTPRINSALLTLLVNHFRKREKG